MTKLGKHDTKTLTKEFAFGKKFTAKVNATAFYYNPDGFMPEFCLTSGVQIHDNKTGKLLGKSIDASRISSDTSYDRLNMEYWIEKGLPFDINKAYTKVDRTFCEGDVAYHEINDTLEAFKKELHEAFGKEYTSWREENKKMKIDNATSIIELAEKHGVENLMTDAELKKWRAGYNKLNNEGHEGYIPARVSIEQYNKALDTIKKLG